MVTLNVAARNGALLEFSETRINIVQNYGTFHLLATHPFKILPSLAILMINGFINRYNSFQINIRTQPMAIIQSVSKESIFLR